MSIEFKEINYIVVKETEKAYLLEVESFVDNPSKFKTWIAKSLFKKDGNLSERAKSYIIAEDINQNTGFDSIDQTEKAFKIKVEFRDFGKVYSGTRFVPKSQCEIMNNGQIKVPTWITSKMSRNKYDRRVS